MNNARRSRPRNARHSQARGAATVLAGSALLVAADGVLALGGVIAGAVAARLLLRARRLAHAEDELVTAAVYTPSQLREELARGKQVGMARVRGTVAPVVPDSACPATLAGDRPCVVLETTVSAVLPGFSSSRSRTLHRDECSTAWGVQDAEGMSVVDCSGVSTRGILRAAAAPTLG